MGRYRVKVAVSVAVAAVGDAEVELNNLEKEGPALVARGNWQEIAGQT